VSSASGTGMVRERKRKWGKGKEKGREGEA